MASGKAATLRIWSSVDRDVGGVLLAVVAPLEHHLEGDPEQQQAAGDPEGRDADPEEPQQHLPAEPEERQDPEGDQRRPHGDPPALGGIHAAGERHEDRRERRRVEGDEEGDERGGDEVGEHGGSQGARRPRVMAGWRGFGEGRRLALSPFPDKGRESGPQIPGPRGRSARPPGSRICRLRSARERGERSAVRDRGGRPHGRTGTRGGPSKTLDRRPETLENRPVFPHLKP